MTTPETPEPVMSWSGLFMSLRDHLIKTDLVINEYARGFAEFSGNTRFTQYVGKKVKFHQVYLMKSGGIKVTVSPVGRSSLKFVVPLGCLSHSCSPSTPIFSSFQPSCLVLSRSLPES
jgi:hypothetical protein